MTAAGTRDARDRAYRNLEYRNLDPQVARFLARLAKQGGPPIYTLSVDAARRVLNDLQASSYGTVPAHVQDLTVPTRSLGDVSIRIVRPANCARGERLPAVMYFHGG